MNNNLRVSRYSHVYVLGKDRGKPPGVHDPTRTHTPEGYIPLPRGKGYVRGTSSTPGYVVYPGAKRNATTRDGCPNQCLVSVSHTHTMTTLQPDITPGALAMPELKEGLVRLSNTTPRIRQLDLEDACDITAAGLLTDHASISTCSHEARNVGDLMNCIQGFNR